jgi:hypothetical protein
MLETTLFSPDVLVFGDEFEINSLPTGIVSKPISPLRDCEESFNLTLNNTEINKIADHISNELLKIVESQLIPNRAH